MKNGYVQIYTGNGKGKTTASLGLAFRAAGAGFKIWIGQFLKNGDFSEVNALRKFSDNITHHQFGMPGFVFGKPSDEDFKKAHDGLKLTESALFSGDYDVVILDELNTAYSIGLVDLEDIKKLCNNKPTHVELIMTGRGADEELFKLANLVTEMREVKHYFKEGVQARVGIEK